MIVIKSHMINCIKTYLFLLIFINIVLSANIKGTILDSESNEPLIGANVYIKDTSKGSATDASGSYFIADVRHCSTCEYKLKVMYIGYEEYEEVIYVYTDEDITKDLKIKPTPLQIETHIFS